MRTLSLFLSILFIITSCQQPKVQYAESGPEIDMVKAVIEAYEAGDWEKQKSFYADTAKMFHNAVDGIPVGEGIDNLNSLLSAVSEYEFEDDIEFEFTTTNEGIQWVSWWGVWNGKLKANGQELRTPVHVSAKIEGGKIAREYGYWDNQPMAAALAEIAAAAATENSEE